MVNSCRHVHPFILVLTAEKGSDTHKKNFPDTHKVQHVPLVYITFTHEINFFLILNSVLMYTQNVALQTISSAETANSCIFTVL